MSDAIHLVDIHAQNAEIRQEVDEALREVVDFGAFVLGPMAAAFEDEFSDYLGVAHTVACNSGTDALMLACDVVREMAGPGQIITTPFTFFATAEAIVQAGHEVVFADIDADTFTLRSCRSTSTVSAPTSTR
jgi:dTDP-4-amino-4,6-dideoxygalactose transaminase